MESSRLELGVCAAEENGKLSISLMCRLAVELQSVRVVLNRK